MRFVTCSEADLGKLIEQCPPERGLKALLSGDLGAGKSTWVRHWLEHYGAEPTYQGSPTFAYHFRYRLPGMLEVDHFDLFRIEHPAQLHDLGLSERLLDNSALAWVEWPERLPPNWRWNECRVSHFKFSLKDDGRHEVEF